MGEVLNDVKQAEAAVYGDTCGASSVVVRLFGSPKTSLSVADGSTSSRLEVYVLVGLSAEARCHFAGRALPASLNSRPFPFTAVEVAGQRLEVADSFELAVGSLWLLLRLGGVGAGAVAVPEEC